MVIIRHATKDDAHFIALVVIEALGEEIMQKAEEGNLTDNERHRIELLEAVVLEFNTLYSWTHTLVAEAEDGTPLGAIVSYHGDDYMAMRARTFDMLSDVITFDIAQMDAETQPGEYYLDSLAVSPAARGKGVGRQLLLAAIDEARALGRPAFLACDPENLGAKALYEAMGFQENGSVHIFGHRYLRLIMNYEL